MVITGGLWRGRAAQQQQSPIAGSFAGNLFLLLTVLVAGWGLDAPAGSVRVASACFRVARCREFCGKNPLRRLGDARGEGTHSVRLGLPRPDESGLSGCVCHYERTKPEGHLWLKRLSVPVPRHKQARSSPWIFLPGIGASRVRERAGHSQLETLLSLHARARMPTHLHANVMIVHISFNPFRVPQIMGGVSQTFAHVSYLLPPRRGGDV